MSFERPDVVFYDSEINTRFSEALVESVVVPAYFTAIQLSHETGMDDGDVMADCEHYFEGNRTEYDFFAEMSRKDITITSTIYQTVEDLSFAAVLLINDEIQYSAMSEELKDQYLGNTHDLYTKSEVETFTRRIFTIGLNDDRSDVRVQTDLGYCVDGHEVTRAAPTDFDLQFQTSFEREDIHEIIRALLSMELINESDVRRFLEHEF